MMMLRQRGIFSVREVAYAIYENNGGMSILRRPAEEQAGREEREETPGSAVALPVGVMEYGAIRPEGLARIGRDEAWLRKQLLEKGIMDEREVAYAEWKEGEGLYIIRTQL